MALYSFEEFLDVRALNLLEHFLERDSLDERQVHLGDLLAVAELNGGIDQARTQVLPQTSGTPRSTISSVYTASMPVRMEYSVVKMVSRVVSAN